MIAHSPAALQQVLELVAVHVAHAVVTRLADFADFAELAGDDFHVAGNAAGLVVGNDETMQVDKALVVGD